MMVYHGAAFLLSFGLSLKRSFLMKDIGGSASPSSEYSSLVIPVAFLIAGSTRVFVFFVFCDGAEPEMERTSLMSALVMVLVGHSSDSDTKRHRNI